MTTALFSHPEIERHEVPTSHPECPQRIAAIMDALHAAGVYDLLHKVEAPEASRHQLERVHAPDYIDELEARTPVAGFEGLDPDTFLAPGTLKAAVLAAGAAVHATELVLDGDVENAFCCTRPPGHHARPGAAMGFCYFNNVAVGAAHALATGSVQRVAILDFDIHHGNGTEEIFHGDRRVLLCSAYEHPFYPYTGVPTEPDHVVNVPLPAGTGGDAFRQAIEAEWFPSIERFSPEFIFISAGFDARAGDPLGDFLLTDDDYRWITDGIVGLAAVHAGGRIVSCLEGGYGLQALGGSVVAHLRSLARL